MNPAAMDQLARLLGSIHDRIEDAGFVVVGLVVAHPEAPGTRFFAITPDNMPSDMPYHLCHAAAVACGYKEGDHK